MSRATRSRVAVLVAAAVLLTGCGAPAIDTATAGDLQAGVRSIASAAAAGDAVGAIALAQSLKQEVDAARAAGTVTEDRATTIGLRLDAVIASLDAGRVPADDASTAVPGEEPVEPTEAPVEVPTETPVEVPTETPAPAATDAPPAPATPTAPAPTPEENAEDGADTGSEDAGEGAGEDAVQGEQGGRAADKAAEQQRKAEEKAREAAEKAAERAAEKAKESGGKGKPDN
jgi:hypothetical protein